MFHPGEDSLENSRVLSNTGTNGDHPGHTDMSGHPLLKAPGGGSREELRAGYE